MVRNLCEETTLLSVYLVLLWHNFDRRRRRCRSIMKAGHPSTSSQQQSKTLDDRPYAGIHAYPLVAPSIIDLLLPQILGCIDQFLGSLLDDNNALNNETTTPRIIINIYEATVWVLGGVCHRIRPPGYRTSTISYRSMDDDDMSWVLVPSTIDVMV